MARIISAPNIAIANFIKRVLDWNTCFGLLQGASFDPKGLMSEGQLRALTLNVKVNCEAITSIIEMALASLVRRA